MEKEIAKKASDLGFNPKTVTTKFTHDYLIGGKNVMITDLCIYLYLCEMQKWLREVHNIYVDVRHTASLDGKGIQYYTNWGFIRNLDKEGKQNVNGGYSEYEDWKTHEQALEHGVMEGLKLIKEKYE